MGIPDPEWEASRWLPPSCWCRWAGRLPTVSDQLAEWVRRHHLGSLKTPARIVVVDELPTTATGKVLRRVVRDQMVAAGPAVDGRTPGQPN